jgi:hypothetical protein
VITQKTQEVGSELEGEGWSDGGGGAGASSEEDSDMEGIWPEVMIVLDSIARGEKATNVRHLGIMRVSGEIWLANVVLKGTEYEKYRSKVK